MANEKDTQGQKQQAEKPAPEPARVARDAAREADAPEDALSFPVERLIEDAHSLLGRPSHVVAGALSGVTKKNLTLEETEAAVTAWLDAPVTQEA